MKRRHVELRLAYNGKAYCGWQVQAHCTSIQGLLNQSLSRVLAEEIKTRGASRTDAGVHAHDQRVAFTTTNPIPLDRLARATNMSLPADIQILEAYPAPETPLLRRVSGKHYIYLIGISQRISPFVSDWVWHFRRKTDWHRILPILPKLVGQHDFRAFQSSKDVRENTITTLDHISCHLHGDFVALHFTGNRFLYHQIRNLVGSLILVAEGEWQVDDFLHGWANGDRREMGTTAPASGLHLVRVFMQPDKPTADPQHFGSFLDALLLHQSHTYQSAVSKAFVDHSSEPTLK
ncbi:MAG: tRNA pseudouridine(38-40) synthase TruA [Acidobacteria bacterium]|nr:tRNA pseudouridine(38-40) synthase TruA [Acidobacteriota bacterium]MCB9397938.1 tRNA pseudouridine(38-40) synthase TruA [Acidobacteriota bacterium]